MEHVHPRSICARGLWIPFAKKKKWIITCGKCSHGWMEKRPISEPVSAVCPLCASLNTWSYIEFMEYCLGELG